jgi:hypothetical protein
MSGTVHDGSFTEAKPCTFNAGFADYRSRVSLGFRQSVPASGEAGGTMVLEQGEMPMLRTTQKFLALAVVLGFLLPVLAADDTKTTGKIKSISTIKMQLVLTANKDNKDYTFTCDRDSKVRLSNNNLGKLNDLKVGEEVTVLWQKSGDRNVVREVRYKGR